MKMEAFVEKYNNDPDAIAWMMILNLEQYNADWKADGLEPRTVQEILETAKKVKEGTATMADLLGSQDSTSQQGEIVKGKSGLNRVMKGSKYIVPETEKDWGELSIALFKAEKAGKLNEFVDSLRLAVAEQEVASINKTAEANAAPSLDIAAVVRNAMAASAADGGQDRAIVDNGKVVV